MSPNAIFEVVRETPISNRIVKELNASVLTATFPESGIQFADLYSSRNSANSLVFHGSCAPINGEFKGSYYINLIK